MDIRPIRTDDDHTAALREIERLWGARPASPDGDRLDVLITLVDAYEDERWPIGDPDAVDMLHYAMDELGRSQAELARLLGSRSRASEVLARKRPLTLPMIFKLHREWNLPAEILIKPYRTQET